jgi:hypothetical protein
LRIYSNSRENTALATTSAFRGLSVSKACSPLHRALVNQLTKTRAILHGTLR